MSEKPYGYMAEFDRAEDLSLAARATREAGYREFDAYSPFPILEVSECIGYNRFAIPVIAIGAGLIGCALQYFTQYWLNVIDYPINVGGRPLHSWPAFLPATIIVGILWAAAAALLGMLVLNRLPRLSHPVFEVGRFSRASEDRFFLCICATDPQFDDTTTQKFLTMLAPRSVHVVPG